MTPKILPIQTMALLCALALFPACAKKKKDEKKQEPPVIETPKLTLPGQATDYTTECVGGAGSATVDTLRFTETEMMRVLVDHNTTNCTSLTATTRIYYTYKIGAHKAAGVFELDLEEKDYRLTAETAAVASNWNRIEKCGIHDWTAGEERAVRKDQQNCVSDTLPRRPIFTVLKQEPNRILTNLDITANRDQDGLTPTRRIQTPNITYSKKNTSINPNPNNPSPVGTCPQFSANYACFNGDAEFTGRDIRTNVQSGNGLKTIIQMFLSQNGQRNDLKTYQPEEGERTVEFSGRRFVTRDICANGVLQNTITVSKIGDTANREITERTFQIGERESLVIDTHETVVTDNRPGRESRITTTCQKR